MSGLGTRGSCQAFLGCPGVQSTRLGSQEGLALLSVEAVGPPCQLGGAARREGALPSLRWHPVLREMPGWAASAALAAGGQPGLGRG